MPVPPITNVPRLAPLSEAEPLLLASASPRRREILGHLGIPILVTKVDVDESVLEAEAPDAYLERVTMAKLTAATKMGADIATACAAVLVADTSVIDAGAILGKPT